MRKRLALALVICTQAACTAEQGYQPQVEQGNALRGREALQEFECGVCHVIPGINGARGYVGPPLNSYRRNVYVAGKFPNVPEMLIAWIQDAPSLAPETAMPDVGVTEAQARDIAAYLYTLD